MFCSYEFSPYLVLYGWFDPINLCFLPWPLESFALFLIILLPQIVLYGFQKNSGTSYNSSTILYRLGYRTVMTKLNHEALVIICNNSFNFIISLLHNAESSITNFFSIWQSQLTADLLQLIVTTYFFYSLWECVC